MADQARKSGFLREVRIPPTVEERGQLQALSYGFARTQSFADKQSTMAERQTRPAAALSYCQEALMQRNILAALTMKVPGPHWQIDITVVLAREGSEDFSAEIGIGQDLDWIHDFGQRLSYPLACCFFPSMASEEAHYRS